MMLVSFALISTRLDLVPRSAPVQANFFSQLFAPQSSPADVYRPDRTAPSAGLPASYSQIHSAAIDGVKAALGEHQIVEVDFPAIGSVNARGDGSAQSEQRVHAANAEFACKLARALDGSVALVGCGSGASRALGDGAVQLRDAEGSLSPPPDIAVVVSPTTDEQWDALAKLPFKVVVVNGLLSNGLFPHAYFYKPLTAFSVQTGAVVRRFPGPYECYAVDGSLVELEVPLSSQGRRALPDTKQAQMLLQSQYGTTPRGLS